MKIHHVKYTCIRPFFIKFKKHYCPACKEKLCTMKAWSIVNSESAESKNYDFSAPGGDAYMVGNVKFIWTEFLCRKCQKTYPVQEIYKIEKAEKKR